MTEGAEYPKAVYQDGGDELIWGSPVRTRIVHSESEEMEALAGRWRLHPIKTDPLDHDGDGRKGGSVPGKRRGRQPKVEQDD